QWRYRELQVSEKPGEGNAESEQRGRDRSLDKRRRRAHRLAPSTPGWVELRGWASIETKGCTTSLRRSRRALRALLRMRMALMALRKLVILRRPRERSSRR